VILNAELASVSQRFARFSVEADAYAGPLYSTLSRQVALDEDLLAVARHVRRPPVPNVFFGAIHFLLSEAPQHELAGFYRSLCAEPRPPSEAHHAFRDFVLSNTDRLIPLLETRITQTNEVGRCSFLLPSFTFVHHLGGGRPLALIDVGCSAGLHLRWDRYHYDYGVAQVGVPHAAVRITCELRGTVMPPLAPQWPECSFRLGIDLNPVDLTDPIARRWFDALIWPEHTGRRRLAAAAIEELLREPPVIVKGDAVDVLGVQLEQVPSDATLIVYNIAALCQGGPDDEAAIARILTASSLRRPTFWLHCENEEVRLRAIDRGSMTQMKLANMDGHGRWLEWLRES
jgi:hypothetical protein